MTKQREAHEEMQELALILDGWFDDMYVDTSLRFRTIPKDKAPKEEESNDEDRS